LKSIAVLGNDMMERGFATSHLLAQRQPVRVWKRRPEKALRRVEHDRLFEEQGKRWVKPLGPWFEPSLAGLPLAHCHWLLCSPFCHPKGEP
jgi:hypothetical protein